MSENSLSSMSRAEYDRLSEEVNWSTLKIFMEKSPAHYHHALLEDRDDTGAMKRGRVTHLATFEPTRFRAECIVWEGGVRRGKEWDAFCKLHRDSEILTPDMAYEAKTIAAAARNHAFAANLLARGRAELTLQWVHENKLKAKGRIDFLADLGAIVDLKTTRDASPKAFGVTAARLGYYGQAAYYLDGYQAITGNSVPYYIVAVETARPYVVQVYEMLPDYLEAARAQYLDALGKLKACREANYWPGYAEGPRPLVLPKWAMPEEDNDIEGLGLIGLEGVA